MILRIFAESGYLKIVNFVNPVKYKSADYIHPQMNNIPR